MILFKITIYVENRRQANSREACWRLDKVGPVGETILHIAFIKGQNDIAKKLLEHFPKMVNDVYIGSEYYGDFYILKCSTFVNYWSE